MLVQGAMRHRCKPRKSHLSHVDHRVEASPAIEMDVDPPDELLAGQHVDLDLAHSRTKAAVGQRLGACSTLQARLQYALSRFVSSCADLSLSRKLSPMLDFYRALMLNLKTCVPPIPLFPGSTGKQQAAERPPRTTGAGYTISCTKAEINLGPDCFQFHLWHSGRCRRRSPSR